MTHHVHSAHCPAILIPLPHDPSTVVGDRLIALGFTRAPLQSGDTLSAEVRPVHGGTPISGTRIPLAPSPFDWAFLFQGVPMGGRPPHYVLLTVEGRLGGHEHGQCRLLQLQPPSVAAPAHTPTQAAAPARKGSGPSKPFEPPAIQVVFPDPVPDPAPRLLLACGFVTPTDATVTATIEDTPSHPAGTIFDSSAFFPGIYDWAFMIMVNQDVNSARLTITAEGDGTTHVPIDLNFPH